MAHIWHSGTADLVLLSPLMSSSGTGSADDHIVAVDEGPGGVVEHHAVAGAQQHLPHRHPKIGRLPAAETY